MENKKMIDLDRIKAKINALLLKTEDNGATKAEMNSALEKANQLMLDFFITENDLKSERDKDIITKCVSKSVKLTKTHYDLSMFRYHLAVLFDCKSYTNTSWEYIVVKGKERKITTQTSVFFGYETDVELCCYFIQMIERACLKEKDRFMNSFDYMLLKKKTHGKTLISSFILGFVYEVSEKMQKMYEERVRNIPQSYGLMVIDKKKNIEKQYDELAKAINMGKGRNRKYVVGEQLAYEKGLQRGNEFELIQGIEDDSDDIDLIETIEL